MSGIDRFMEARWDLQGLGNRNYLTEYQKRIPNSTIIKNLLYVPTPGHKQMTAVNVKQDGDIYIYDSPARLANMYRHLRKKFGIQAKPKSGEELKWARMIWDNSIGIEGTPAEKYLAKRGIKGIQSSDLRYHDRLKHKESGRHWPCLVAAVRNLDGHLCGIHRTFISGDSKAPVDPVRKSLGDIEGNAIHLSAPIDNTLCVGEGIETCLSVMMANLPAWSSVSAGNMRKLFLPPSVKTVFVLVDPDPAGRQAAKEAAWRWQSEKRHVRWAEAPEGMDFNDLLMGRSGKAS